MLICQCGFKDINPAKHRLFFPRFAFCFIINLFLLIQVGCGGSDTSLEKSVEIPKVKPVIISTLPHDSQAFTQGFLYHNGELYESTGLVGSSSLRRINPENGNIIKNIHVADVFAEGIAVKENLLIQLTWHNGIAFIYSYPDLKRTGLLEYKGEGWGITANESGFIMSNGCDTLFIRDNTFAVIKKLAVTLKGEPLSKLNELEYANNRIYANVWYSDFIFEIDSESGKVLRIVDCSYLVKQIGSMKEQDVLNGIAYNKEKETFFITGKNWPLIFEVKIPG